MNYLSLYNSQINARAPIGRLQNSRIFCERKRHGKKYSNERSGASVETARENGERREDHLRHFAPSENGRKRLFCSLLIGQSAMFYCASKLMEKSRVF